LKYLSLQQRFNSSIEGATNDMVSPMDKPSPLDHFLPVINDLGTPMDGDQSSRRDFPNAVVEDSVEVGTATIRPLPTSPIWVMMDKALKK